MVQIQLVRNYLLLCTIALLAVYSCSHAQSNEQKEKTLLISYTGNMGVLISYGGTALLVDGLHEYYGPSYQYPPDTLAAQIISREGSFKGLDLLLFTHYHRDHYSAKLARQFLQQYPAGKLLGPLQVTDSVNTQQSVNTWQRNTIVFDNKAGLSVKAIDIPHTWPARHSKVQNTAYIISIGGRTILHVGDADTDIAAFGKAGFTGIDIAMVPAWFLMSVDGKSILTKLVKPRQVIVTHIEPGANGLEKLKLENIPVHFFTRITETISL